MRLIPLTSSSIAAIGWGNDHEDPMGHYGELAGDLAVQFQTKDGSWSGYLYHEVPMGTFVNVITDPESQGKAFDRLIKKGNFSWVKVTPDEVKAIR